MGSPGTQELLPHASVLGPLLWLKGFFPDFEEDDKGKGRGVEGSGPTSKIQNFLQVVAKTYPPTRMMCFSRPISTLNCPAVISAQIFKRLSGCSNQPPFPPQGPPACCPTLRLEGARLSPSMRCFRE